MLFFLCSKEKKLITKSFPNKDDGNKSEWLKGSGINIVGKTKSGGERAEIIDIFGICSCLTATDYKQPKQIVRSIDG